MADAPTELDPSLRREIMQVIHSHYYNVTDREGSAVGGLLVFLDRRAQPVRAELHLHDEWPDEVAATAVRQAYHILGERYFSDESLPLQVRESFVLGETLNVALGDPTLAEESPRRWPIWQLASAAVALIFLVGLIWALSSWFRGSTGGDNPSAVIEQPLDVQPAGESPGDATATPDLPQPTPDGQLPPSKNADPTLKVSDKVHIKAGYKLTLRSEAGAEAGEVIGYMEDGDIAEIIEGPILLPGDSDTIVWWLVKLGDGKQAWAAANTSTTALLERVQ